jgi:hypothetical protein
MTNCKFYIVPQCVEYQSEVTTFKHYSCGLSMMWVSEGIMGRLCSSTSTGFISRNTEQFSMTFGTVGLYQNYWVNTILNQTAPI